VIDEPLGGAHSAPAVAAESIRAALGEQLASLQKFDIDALLTRRYDRLMSYGIA
jgi:acetyl-CoA carboxylase carboxyl transferase subunit alpha